MASIRKHRGKFQVRVRRQGHPTLTRTFSTQADAKEWATFQERQADRGELGPSRKELETVTLADLVTRYRNEVVPGKRDGVTDTFALNLFLKHSICKKTLAALSPVDFTSYRDERLKKISPASVRRHLTPIRHMFRHAQEVWKLPLPKNPLAGARVLNADKRRERRLREDELDRLLEAGKKTRNKLIIPIVRFALETAMRRGELLSLRWRDVDEQRATATLLETKNGYSRVIPLTDTALDILRSVAPEEKNEDSRVFPVRANALRLSWVRLTKRAKIDDLHFHDLRHEAISRFFEMGLSVPEVASISGHRDMRMLFRYAHASHASIRAKFCLRASNEGISVS
jgi:integrase